MTPADLPAVTRLLEAAYRESPAPVAELIRAQTRDPFKILVATILSARTRDETTASAAHRLFQVVNTPDDLERISEQALQTRIFPVGFYRQKAIHLKALPAAMRRISAGRVPDDLDTLCRLPGVGRKTANLVVSVAFNKPAICVDVHVHRISNRLGLVKTRTPLETEMALRTCLPQHYWMTWNRRLVAFGQTRCTPRHPRCKDCPLLPWCDRIGVQTPLSP